MDWKERWIAWRNDRLTDPKFQLWASRIPGIRRMVRKRSAALFNVVGGFVYSQILAACIELRLLEALHKAPLTPTDFATQADLPLESSTRLLRAAVALELCEPLADGRYALGMQGAALLGNPGIAAMIRHHRLLYADLADPVALLRAGRGSLADYWDYDPANPPPTVGDYSALMATSQPMVAVQALEAYDFGQHRHLLDIGGGEGAFLDAIGTRYPALTLSLFDLPAVADRANAKLGSRATIHGGSFIDDPLPAGADLISLVRILHDHDDPVVQALLTKAAQTLGPGGTLIIVEPLADTPSAREMGDGYFGMYLFAMGQGRPRRADEIGGMLKKAGFSSWTQRATPLPLIASVIVAKI